jgi:autoinducer 2 (AI-2) kinase
METGQAFRWIRDIFYTNESGDTYGVMNKEAEKSPPGANGVRAYIGPRLPNYRKLNFISPGGFVTQLPPIPNTVKRGDFSRAVLESVAFGVRLNVERLQRVSGLDISVLRVSGGLSKSNLLMQMLANLIGVKVTVPLHQEGSSLGAAICAGVGAGKFRDMSDGVNQLVILDKTFLPEDRQTYEPLYQMWMSEYSKMYGEGTPKE